MPRAEDLRRGGLALLPGLGAALGGFLVALSIGTLVPAIPVLTACVVLGVLVAAVPWPAGVGSALRPVFASASRRLLRIGIVLLGFRVSLLEIAGLGWLVLALVVAIVVVTFVVTLVLGRLARLPGDEPILLAAGFSICGVSAIGAMSGVTRSRESDTATPIALVTLCGSLAIAVLPALKPVLGLDAAEFGMWTGASVHDVGQVVATAQVAGSTALAIAVVVKLARVALLAPMVAIAGLVLRRGGSRPVIVPLFVAAFLTAVIVRTVVPLPPEFLDAAADVQFLLLGVALFALGVGIRLGSLIRTGARPLAVAGISWAAIAALSLAAVLIARAAGVPALG